MPKHLLIPCLVALVLSIAWASCSKSSSGNNNNNVTLLTKGTWKFDTSGIDLDKNGTIDQPDPILEKAPSAELRPDQKDSDSLPEYDVLDKVLYQYIERRQGPREIVALGIDEALVKRVLRLVNTNEYKRNQFCPIIRVSCKAFGVGRRVPIVGKYLS